MKYYKALLLDLDNTLYDYKKSHEKGLIGLHEALAIQGFSLDETLKAYQFARTHVKSKLKGTAASHHRLLYMKILCEKLKLNPTRYALSLSEAYWQAFLESMFLFKDTFAFLSQWKIQNGKLALVTDLTAEIQLRKLLKLGLEDIFDCLIFSEEIGRDKPHPDMFLTALKKLNLRKKEVLMIGDDLEKDIKGAKAIGIDAWHFSNEKEFNHSINFSDLLSKLHE